MPAVTAEHIVKTYTTGELPFGKPRRVTALKDISLEVEGGEIFGLIGPDGAGKTSLFRILNTLLLADSGTATVNGYDVVKDYRQIRESIGYMPGRFSLYQDLTVEENLRFFATVFRTTIEENYDLIRDIYVQIEPFKDRKVAALSGGMKQKLALSCALVHKPTVLFLDEPTTGVDPVSRKEFWGMLKRLKKQGIAILVSTPYMDEARLCDRIALIKDGVFLQTDTPENIVAGFDRPLWSVHSRDMSALLKDLRRHERVDTCHAFGDTHHVTFRGNPPAEGELINYLHELGHKQVVIHPIQASVEDCFMRLAGQPAAS